MSGEHFPITLIGDPDYETKRDETVGRLLKNAGMPLPERLTVTSPIARLRALHPDREWKAVRTGFNSYEYESGGWTARWVADLEDDGDVGPPSRLCIYKDDGPPEWAH